jgi:hypothetical protein
MWPYFTVPLEGHIRQIWLYKSGALFLIKLLLFIEKYLYYHKNDGSASIFGMMREERSLKFKFESWPPIIGGIMKIKRANRLMSIIDEIWMIHLQKVDTLLMICSCRLTFSWWVSLVEQECLTLVEHLSSLPFFCGLLLLSV